MENISLLKKKKKLFSSGGIESSLSSEIARQGENFEKLPHSFDRV